MKIFTGQNVYEAAKDRLRWIYDEFPNVVVSYSGGKDSDVVLNLAIEIATEKGRLPQKVAFLDQEAEYQATVDHVRSVMYREDVTPYWFQMPIKIFNATSADEQWLECWSPDDEGDWMHEKDPISIKENVYGTDRFAEAFTKIMGKIWPDEKSCFIAGVRTEESPSR